MRFLLIFLLFTSVIVYGQKNDTIVHINGNILTGEIKRLDYGIITYKMDGMGNIDFQTKKVKNIVRFLCVVHRITHLKFIMKYYLKF